MNMNQQSFFWVNHKQTFKIEIGEGYLWSPKSNTNGSFNQTYENMKSVKPGDIVFSYAMGVIQAVGCATSSSYEAENPFNMENWGKIGWKVDVDFFYIENKFKPKNFIDEIRNLLPAKYSPISPSTGNGNQGCYLAEINLSLAEYIYEKIDPEIQLPILKLDSIKEENIPQTSKSAYVLQRIGQNIFRDKLIKKFDSCCPVTGVRLNELLRASHIKPWRISNDTERLDAANGILLASHIDILFDKGFISFDDDGRILTKNNEVIELLNKMNIQISKIDLPVESKRYLKWHRDYFSFDL